MNRLRSRGASLVTLLVLITVLAVFAVALMQLYVTSAQLSSDRAERAQAEAIAEGALAQASLGLRVEENQQDACDEVTQVSVTLNNATGEIIESQWISGRCHVRARGTTRTAERYIRGVLRGRGELLSNPELWQATPEQGTTFSEGSVTLVPVADGGFDSFWLWFFYCVLLGLDCSADEPQATLSSDDPQGLFPTRFQDTAMLPVLNDEESPWFVADVVMEDDEPASLSVALETGNGTMTCAIDIDNGGTIANGDGCNSPAPDAVPDKLTAANVVVVFDGTVAMDDLDSITISVTTEAPSVTIRSPCLGRPGYCAAHTRPLEPWTWGYGTGE